VKAREKYEGEAVDYGKALYEWKLQKEAAEARARADLKKNPEAKVSFDIAEPQAPMERRFITNDTTYEKLGEILAQNPNGILAHRDELVSLLRTLVPGGVRRGAWFLPDRGAARSGTHSTV